MREIILDTETTGLDFRKGDRLIEIGCIELINRIPTGREYHCFINPERDVPAEAEAVHGITTAFLVGSGVALGASLIIWLFLNVKHEELSTDGPQAGAHVG